MQFEKKKKITLGILDTKWLIEKMSNFSNNKKILV